MSLHINRFIDSIKAAESRGQKDLVMTLRDAKDLHGDITKLLLALQQLTNQMHSNQNIEVVISGGSFKST
jgi:histone acetyltransferase (RNA polymerase elongator complex component)